MSKPLCTKNLKVVEEDLKFMLWDELDGHLRGKWMPTNRTVMSTFSAVFLEAVENILRMHGDRLSSHLLVDIELLLQSADDYRQVFLSHLHNIDVEHKYWWFWSKLLHQHSVYLFIVYSEFIGSISVYVEVFQGKSLTYFQAILELNQHADH